MNGDAGNGPGSPLAPGPPVQRYAAFTEVATGGNPAGVVLDARGMTSAAMLAVAAELGYSETAFLTPSGTARELAVRYFSPLAEVPFCGHATIASAVAFAERNGVGDLVLQTGVGPVTVATSVAGTRVVATLTSVPTTTAELPDHDLAELLGCLGWQPDELDPLLPVRVGYAGAWHPILAARTRERLDSLSYDFDRLAARMRLREWTTIALIWRESETVFWARNPFPPGGIVEDPATGAAAAALGGYLRELGGAPPALTIHQGSQIGRPSTLTVEIPPARSAGVRVSGSAVAIS